MNKCTLGFSGLGVVGRASGSSCSGAGTGVRPVLTGEGESDVGDGLRGGVDGGTGEADDDLQWEEDEVNHPTINGTSN